MRFAELLQQSENFRKLKDKQVLGSFILKFDQGPKIWKNFDLNTGHEQVKHDQVFIVGKDWTINQLFGLGELIVVTNRSPITKVEIVNSRVILYTENLIRPTIERVFLKL